MDNPNSSSTSESTEITIEASNAEPTTEIAAADMKNPNSAPSESTEITNEVSVLVSNAQPTTEVSAAAATSTVIKTNSLHTVTIVIKTNSLPTVEFNTSNRDLKGPSESNEIANEVSVSDAGPTTAAEDALRKGPTIGRRHWLMYRAALCGDWPAAAELLKQDRSLASDVITERGDRALHLSIAMKHKRFAQKLLIMLSPSELELTDMNGYTACCYAALSGMVEINEMIGRRNSGVLVARNANNFIPLQVSILGEEKKMIMFLLKVTGVECLSQDEWFDLLNYSISNKMPDVGLKILEKNGSLALVRNQARVTALHMLAQQDISERGSSKTATLLKSILGTTFYGRHSYGEMHADCRLLAEKLLANIQNSMDETSALCLLGDPPILNEAAKVGNVELILMLTRAYPDLIWQLDAINNYSMFHIAIMHRQDNVFTLIKQIGGLKNFVIMGTDGDDNNILHLAAKLGPLNTRNNLVSISALQMQRELAWFKEVEALVSTWCVEAKNKKNKKPRELFSEEHRELVRESEAWMRSTADSCMLIATIILTVVYAAAFTAPGGNNGDTGVPLLLGSKWFTCFFIFEALALFCSTLCIITFWSITSSGFEEERFLEILPYQLKFGLSGLFGSLIGAISAFMSAYCLVFVGEGEWVVKLILLLIYVMLVLAICGRFSELWFKMRLPKSLPKMLSNRKNQSLFTGYDAAISEENVTQRV